MGAVEVSRLGGLRQRSVFGGAASVKEPIHSGTASLGMLSAVKEELSGGMAGLDRAGESKKLCELLARNGERRGPVEGRGWSRGASGLDLALQGSERRSVRGFDSIRESVGVPQWIRICIYVVCFGSWQLSQQHNPPPGWCWGCLAAVAAAAVRPGRRGHSPRLAYPSVAARQGWHMYCKLTGAGAALPENYHSTRSAVGSWRAARISTGSAHLHKQTHGSWLGAEGLEKRISQMSQFE